MNDEMNQATSSLEEQIAQLTTWQGEEPQTWRAALETVKQGKIATGGAVWRFMRWPQPKALAAVILVVLIGAVLMAIFETGPRIRTHSVASMSPVRQQEANPKQMGAASATSGTDFPWQRARGEAAGEEPQSSGGGGRGGGGGNSGANLYSAAIMPSYYTPEIQGDGGQQNHADVEAATNRAVVRKAQIDLLTDDVRSAFLKAQHLVSEVNGEYVQESALIGTEKDKNLQANLTLRIAADRLSAVLNDLRALGKVNAESSGGEDVTAQMVDLEARLRNEQRVEKELLELLEKRTDAPLKEILELRDTIGRVRQTIEVTTAQRERLGRLVSLATVLVIIRTEAAPPVEKKPAEKSIGQYFGENVSAAWTNGLVFLADTIAALLRIIVGGIIWWTLAVLLALFVRQSLRRRMEIAATRA